MDFLNAVNHTLGNIEKAQIHISTYNMPEEKQWEIKEIVPAKGASMGGIPGAGSIAGGAANALAAGAATGLNKLADQANAVADKLVGSEKTYTVQFNPNQLSISGYGGGMYQKTNYGVGSKNQDKNNGISFEPAKVRLMLNVTLIFDQVSVKDAFMADKIAMSPTAILTGAATLAKELITKEEYSVQPIVEGFIGMLRQERTRFVTFCWGSMRYEGVVNSLNTSYTMFNLTGQPIRAEVEMSMILVDEEVGPDNMGTWQEHYNQAFGRGNLSLKNKTQVVGNLLNI